MTLPMRRRLRLSPIVFGVLLLAGCSTNGSPSSSSPSAVNIGLPAAFTGGTVQYGEPWFQGAQVAADYINSNGGIMGAQVNLIPVDTGGDPVDAVPAVRRMLALDNISMSLGLSGLDWTDSLSIINAAHMVNFSHIGSPATDHLTYKYSFATGSSDALMGSAMALYASIKGYHKIALAFDASVGAQTLVPSIMKAAQVLGLTVVASPAIPLGAPSYEAEVLQIMQAHPDVILTQLQPSLAGTFFQELVTLGGAANQPVIGSDLTLEKDWFAAVGSKEVQAHIVSLNGSSRTTGIGYQTFLTGYTNRYHTAPPYLGVNSYDGLTIGALAMIDAHSTDPSVYVNDILDVTTPGAGKTTVYTFAQGATLLREGKKIKYYGASGPMVYNQYHRVSGDFTVDQGTSTGLTQIAVVPADQLNKLVF
jgi:branched-chain amino acid transport system substrate-binding protein